MKNDENVPGSTRPAGVRWWCYRWAPDEGRFCKSLLPWVGAYQRLSDVGKEKDIWTLYWILQHFPVVCWPYGSSARPTGPQTEGTRWSFVVLQYRIRLALASLTLIRGRARSSLRRWLCSIRRLNFSSDIDCRPPVRVLMMASKSWYRWIWSARCWERGWGLSAEIYFV